MNSERHLDDESLSALIDGGSDGRAHTESCAACAARLAALTDARQALHEIGADDADHLDELARMRLIRNALAAADQTPADIQRARRWAAPVAALASVAAVVALVVGFASGSSTPTTAKKLSAAGPVRALGSLGDVSTGDRLRAALVGQSEALSAGSGAQGYTAGGGSANGSDSDVSTQADALSGAEPLSPSGFAARSATNEQTAKSSSPPAAPSPAAPLRAALLSVADAQRCATTVRRSQRPGRFAAWGSATYAGQDALVLSFEREQGGATRHRVFVVEPTSCTVLTFATY